jgi:nicotinamidase-related amidase
MKIQVPIRLYCATPTHTPKGLVEETIDLETEKTAFVMLHCWNFGCPGGEPVPDDYWVFMGAPQNHEVAWHIMRDQIVPLRRLMRKAKMNVVHVQPESVAARYPTYVPPDPVLQETHSRSPKPISSHASDRSSIVHGPGYMQWSGWETLDTPEPLRPKDGETMVVTTRQFDNWLRDRGITSLIYTGFATNLCILESPAAMKAMAALGYRCVILREGTLAVEFPETLAERRETKSSIRYIESWVGYSASTEDLANAVEAA